MRKPSRKKIEGFQEFLLDWYSKNGRVFPWRETSDPYLILVSEILLQKTHVRVVQHVYPQFVNQYPDLTSLSNADVTEVEEILRPLGFLNRAERLVGIAKKVFEDYNGSIPNDYKNLLDLKGIGPYIATAVMVFAFNDQRVVVDTNVLKVLKKHFNIKSDKPRPRNDKEIWDVAQTLAPAEKIKEFNWALLDYGATL